MLDARNEVRAQLAYFAGLFDIGQSVQQFLQHHLYFQTRQIGAQAEVLTVAERQMIVRRSPNVEAVRIGKGGRVAIG